MRSVLVDENFPRAAAVGLEAGGHDVVSVATVAPGLDDLGVLEFARLGQRWLLSFDADFGELVFHRSALPPPGILFFRIHPVVISEVIALALHALVEVREGTFTVVTREGMRIRPFPQGSMPSIGAEPGGPSTDG